MHLPKISVIIGVLNMRSFLADALESLINQDYPNLELIVMDGGSTDGTQEVIKQYEQHIVHWQSSKDKSHSDACNKAIKIATGDYIHFLNADDKIVGNLLYKVAEKFRQNPKAQMITCGVDILKKNKMGRFFIDRRITEPSKLQLTLYNMLFELPVINARFFHSDLFARFGEFRTHHPDGSTIISNDREFLIKLALAGIRTEIIPEPLYQYLSHEESISFSNKNVVKSHIEHMALAEHLLKSNLSPQQIFIVKKWLRLQTIYLILIYLSRLEIKNAFSVSKYGLKNFGLLWVGRFFGTTLAVIYRKLKKKLAKPLITQTQGA